MKRHVTTIILLLVFLVGLSLLLYPTFADWWNSMHQSRAVASYVEQVANIDTDQYAHLWNAAWEYNVSLVGRHNSYLLSNEQKAEYDQLLNVGGIGTTIFYALGGVLVLVAVVLLVTKKRMATAE